MNNLKYQEYKIIDVILGEEKQPKGFVVLDIDKDTNATYEYVEIESQKFCTLKFNFKHKK
jgi:hypothetical protein